MGVPMSSLTLNNSLQKYHRRKHLDGTKPVCISKPAKVDSRIVSVFILQPKPMKGEGRRMGGGGTEVDPLPPCLYGFSGELSM